MPVIIPAFAMPELLPDFLHFEEKTIPSIPDGNDKNITAHSKMLKIPKIIEATAKPFVFGCWDSCGSGCRNVSVKTTFAPHFVQKAAPSKIFSPQCMQNIKSS